jgi:hypothetical protein
MDQLMTPLDALHFTGEDTPRPELTPHEDPMLERIQKMSDELSESEAYDAQILAGLVTP